MKTQKILEFFGIADDQSEEESNNELDNRQLFEAEITETISEIAVMHADTKEYQQAVTNLQTLTEAYHSYERAITEKEKIVTEQINSDRQWKIKLIDVVPRVAGLVCSASLTGLWFMVEQQHPTANRLVNKTNDLLVRP